jgi:lysophospholipase L1-like esterase
MASSKCQIRWPRWRKVGPLVSAVIALNFCTATADAEAAPPLPCGPFTSDVLAAPEPREAQGPVERFGLIRRWVKTERYRVLFLGDSLTERFDPLVWHDHMAPRGVFNAGISGDRTDHLLWRLKHGNLEGPPPAGVVLLIGTNDLGYGRPPEIAAEGIRANLLYLRQRLPRARILLLGLLPREASPDARLRRATVAVNRLIQGCGDGSTIIYSDIGGVLLDAAGKLTPEIAPDQLHFSRLGYTRLAPRLDTLIDDLVAGR